jgi:hypothetical protein
MTCRKGSVLPGKHMRAGEPPQTFRYLRVQTAECEYSQM